jgi:hypothetical protein
MDLLPPLYRRHIEIILNTFVCLCACEILWSVDDKELYGEVSHTHTIVFGQHCGWLSILRATAAAARNESKESVQRDIYFKHPAPSVPLHAPYNLFSSFLLLVLALPRICMNGGSEKN